MEVKDQLLANNSHHETYLHVDSPITKSPITTFYNIPISQVISHQSKNLHSSLNLAPKSKSKFQSMLDLISKTSVLDIQKISNQAGISNNISNSRISEMTDKVNDDFFWKKKNKVSSKKNSDNNHSAMQAPKISGTQKAFDSLEAESKSEQSSLQNLKHHNSERRLILKKEPKKYKYTTKKKRSLTKLFRNKNRDIIKFGNVYDSFDSENEERDYEYYDYVRRRISVDIDSDLHLFIKKFKKTFIFLMILIYSSFLAVLDPRFYNSKAVLSISLTAELLLQFQFLINYLLIPFQDPNLKKPNYNHLKIFINRYETKFLTMVLDLISVFPSSAISLSFNSNNTSLTFINVFFKLFFLSKLSLIYHLRRWIHFSSIFEYQNKSLDSDKSAFSKSKTGMYLVCLRIVLFFILIIHVFACIWLSITSDFLYFSNHNNWIVNSNLEDSPLIDLYVCSVYFSVTTLFTVGYGDIKSYNPLERVVVIVFLIIGCLIYSLVLTIVSGLMKTHNIKDKVYQERLDTLYELYHIYRLPYDLYRQLQSSIDHNFETWKGDKEELLSVLPNSIRTNLQLKIYESFIKKFNFFLNVEDNNFILSIASKLNSHIFEKERYILETSDNLEEMFFIAEGNILLSFRVDQFNECKLAKLSSGMNYGDILMYTYNRSPFDFLVLSQTCTVYTLKKNDFEVLKSNFDAIMVNLLKEGYRVHFYIETKKNHAIEYYKRFHDLMGFEASFKNFVDTAIYNELFSEGGSLINDVNEPNTNRELEDQESNDNLQAKLPLNKTQVAKVNADDSLSDLNTEKKNSRTLTHNPMNISDAKQIKRSLKELINRESIKSDKRKSISKSQYREDMEHTNNSPSNIKSYPMINKCDSIKQPSSPKIFTEDGILIFNRHQVNAPKRPDSSLIMNSPPKKRNSVKPLRKPSSSISSSYSLYFKSHLRKSKSMTVKKTSLTCINKFELSKYYSPVINPVKNTNFFKRLQNRKKADKDKANTDKKPVNDILDSSNKQGSVKLIGETRFFNLTVDKVVDIEYSNRHLKIENVENIKDRVLHFLPLQLIKKQMALQKKNARSILASNNAEISKNKDDFLNCVNQIINIKAKEDQEDEQALGCKVAEFILSKKQEKVVTMNPQIGNSS